MNITRRNLFKAAPLVVATPVIAKAITAPESGRIEFDPIGHVYGAILKSAHFTQEAMHRVFSECWYGNTKPDVMLTSQLLWNAIWNMNPPLNREMVYPGDDHTKLQEQLLYDGWMAQRYADAILFMTSDSEPYWQNKVAFICSYNSDPRYSGLLILEDWVERWPR